MNKLIKLLNKYLKYKEDIGPDKLTRVKSVDTTGDIIFELNNGGHWNLWYVISKEYGFIKWLVENNKIDTKKVSEKELATGWNLENNMIDEENTKESWIKFWTESLLMLLAISDSPIRFLTNILK